ncbi:PREDICTED: type-1 protein phosphatase inhibitor 4-like [Chrysochloris asiatica]|uniref:Type-1 protein phosphatase inhibitor 4-like n=1 Tax=Chrysochloris asiatica TaxID=185453 RepID=A0A9B0TI92_CHRAS|nr:PREDICTED: type-1 protein phosphatase inhibitor 4-like [Chrysochloris asiatica]
MAASTTSHRPIKGILKNKLSSTSSTSSVAASAQQPGGAIKEVRRKKSQKWDEASIRATYRLSYKDYELMKVNEPGTPYLTMPDEGAGTVNSSEMKEALIQEYLVQKLAACGTSDSNYQVEQEGSLREEEWQLLLAKHEKQRQFELKRKLHYNEGLNLKLARQLISKDLLGLGEEEKNENEECPYSTNEEHPTTEESKEGLVSDELKAKSCDS